jgi:PDDEXK-like domain of unknown function (DUF3799)
VIDATPENEDEPQLRIHSAKTECPPPGIIYGKSYEEYDSWDALRVSTLKHADKSAKHLKAAIDGRLSGEDTADKRLGRAIHVRLLEPNQWEWRFKVAGPCQAVLKSGANKGERCGLKGTRYNGDDWFCGKHAGDGCTTPIDYVTQAEFADLNELDRAVKAHQAVKLLRKHGGSEVSVSFDLDGVRMKGRIDKYIHESADWPASILDIKKVQVGACTEYKCQQAVQSYAYHAQLAAYWSALKELEGIDAACYLVFVEDSAPFDVMVMQASPADLECGLNDLHHWLHMYKTGIATGKWPGRAQDIVTGICPDRMLKTYAGNY